MLILPFGFFGVFMWSNYWFCFACGCSSVIFVVVVVRHGKTGGSGRVRVESIGLQVKWVVGQNESF